MVRPDVLKGEDMQHIMGGLQRIDIMKLSLSSTLMLGEKVLQNKRKSAAQSLFPSRVDIPSSILKHPALHPSTPLPVEGEPAKNLARNATTAILAKLVMQEASSNREELLETVSARLVLKLDELVDWVSELSG
ncbi:hypothetical protein HPB52_000285 [Rhipicephalus sanguineus]|uniref:Uncharacterized protein n=1 Tax=Rhipicephalus sanguineus TaxID=34632 RepID=A0A9D4SX23_RHISA|nr:hypothetical protein HPB52_000285 [Rhipicephalus sanguineus]